MRHATEPGEGSATEARARKFENGAERDAYLESNYRYHEHDQWESTLAFVWVHAEELQQEFTAYWEKCGGEWDEQLRRFEVKRFGNQLELGAHAILRFRVVRTIDRIRKRGREPRVLFESITERLTWEHATESTPREAIEVGTDDATRERNDTRTIRRLSRIVAMAQAGMAKAAPVAPRMPYREPEADWRDETVAEVFGPEEAA